MPGNHLPKMLVVAPNTRARATGMASMKDELRVGWKHNFNNVVHWWGSCKNRAALKKLVADVRKKYGDIEVIERDSDV